MLFILATVALNTIARDSKVNVGWEFQRMTSSIQEGKVPGDQPVSFTPWQVVNLPHSAKPLDELHPEIPSFQGIVYYKKTFKSCPAMIGKRVVLRFDGAMQVAEIWVNGKLAIHHTGGYLPFEVNLSNELGNGKDAEVTAILDNRDNPDFNPGRSQSQLDFTYAGGLYRDVWLEVTNVSHIKDVYGYTVTASKKAANVGVQIDTEGAKVGAKVEIDLVDPKGKNLSLGKYAADSKVERHFNIPKPILWDLDHPALYQLNAKLLSKGQVLDELKIKFGIRQLEFKSNDSFRLNGKAIRLQGANRHMAFPVVGNAASDSAQYREAKLLKSYGLNILRLSHYPQSTAFLDACDEVGILVIDPIPGWQFFKNTEEFKNHVLMDVHEMVQRDRNHPCVALFETCLNETYNVPDSFWIKCSQAAHMEFDPGNFFTAGDSYGKQDYTRPIWDVPWTGWDDQAFARPALFKMQKGIDREYGDYEFGGEESTSRADRGDGEGALMLQAWNFIWSHNRNRGNPWSYGDLTWEAIDTLRGMSQTSPISKSGMLDYYRLPKPIAFFFRSQDREKPYVHIANQWTPKASPTKVVVFSNCDEVALYLNGELIARRSPDHGPTTGYIGPKVADPLYWAHGSGEILPASRVEESVGGAQGALPFSGTNCKNLASPPFTFDNIPFASGKLVAVGFRNHKRVASHVEWTPLEPTHIELEVSTMGRRLEADGSDFVFVYAKVLDKNNQVVPDYQGKLFIQLFGEGRVISVSQRNAVAGIAPFMIASTTQPGKIKLVARGVNLKPGTAQIRSHE